MPAGIGYGNDRHLRKAIKRKKFSPITTSEEERLRLANRRAVDRAIPQAGAGKQTLPPPPSAGKSPGEKLWGALTGNSEITDAFKQSEATRKRQQKRNRR